MWRRRCSIGRRSGIDFCMGTRPGMAAPGVQCLLSLQGAGLLARVLAHYMFQRHPVQNDVCMLITTVVAHRRKIFRNPMYARQAIETLYKVQELYPFLLFGFVFMPDHCHLLLTVPAPQSISQIMNSFKIGVCHDIGLGPLWQSRFHIIIPQKGSEALHYIHLNPVRAGLAESAEQYRWSSASGMWDVTPLNYWW